MKLLRDDLLLVVELLLSIWEKTIEGEPPSYRVAEVEAMCGRLRDFIEEERIR